MKRVFSVTMCRNGRVIVTVSNSPTLQTGLWLLDVIETGVTHLEWDRAE